MKKSVIDSTLHQILLVPNTIIFNCMCVFVETVSMRMR
jgi:hypothetical protein